MPIARGTTVWSLAMLLASVAPWLTFAAPHEAKAQDKVEKPAAPAARRHVGTVKAVDPATGTLTVGEKGGDAEVSVTKKTAIRKGKKSLKLSNLKPGDAVNVVYIKQDGRDVARSVTVASK